MTAHHMLGSQVFSSDCSDGKGVGQQTEQLPKADVESRLSLTNER